MNTTLSTTSHLIQNTSDMIDTNTTGSSLNVTSDTNGSTSQSFLYVVPGPVICVCGIIWNGLNLIVLSHKTLHESPYTYIRALSVSDMTLLSISLFSMTAFNLPGTFFKVVFDLYVFFFFGNACFNFGVWVIVSMTIERVYFVLRPLKTTMSRWRTRLKVLTIFIVSIVLNIPRLFCFEIISEGGSTYKLSGTDFRKSKEFYEISWVHAVIINFIPLIILAVTNATMIITLRKAYIARLAMTGQHSRTHDHDQVRMTRTLVAIVILFFICVTPSAFVDYPIAYALFGHGKKWDEYLTSPANLNLIYISNLLLFANSSLNFILYCVFNRKFLAAMKDTFRRLRPGSRKKQSSSITSTKTTSTRM